MLLRQAERAYDEGIYLVKRPNGHNGMPLGIPCVPCETAEWPQWDAFGHHIKTAYAYRKAAYGLSYFFHNS